MSREISRAEAWERAHEVFTQVNFNAFDYSTVKESLLDYVKLYFPEDFNDYIESSEFIAILELFAYVAELLAYRIDLNAHENFITTAQRKESILRLAKLISYKASRNIPGRGLVKMTSIQTTETILDSAGRNLAGRRIYWNDTNNSDWKEQFLLVLNRVLEQEYGSVAADERAQVADVLFELYTMNNIPFGTGDASRVAFTAAASGTSAPMEIVPIELTADGPVERRPERDAKFSIVYASDGLGDGSDTTGFLMYVKQGQLNVRETVFDGVTPNQSYDVAVNNINETDLWVNNVTSDTSREMLLLNPYAELMPHLVADDTRFGEWIEVDLANAQNIIFNTNRNRHKYEVETLDNDQLRIIFGDGEFSDVPQGSFDIWFRTSLNQDYVIEKTAVIDQGASLSYTDVNGSVQTLSFTFSLVSSIQNASASEDIEHIRRVAPSVYYTQDRMVNARDYNVFMLQDPTILKLRSVNRTFAGDSKYIAWHDPSDSYENVKVFGDDLALYWRDEDPDTGNTQTVPVLTSSNEMLNNYIEPLLSTADFYATIAPMLKGIGVSELDVRTEFSTDDYTFGQDAFGNTNEVDAILYKLDNVSTTGGAQDFGLFYSVAYDEWTVDPHPVDAYSIRMIIISRGLSDWTIQSRIRRMIAQSTSTKFWVSDRQSDQVDFDTLNTNNDRIVVLKANEAALNVQNYVNPLSGQCEVSRSAGILDANREFVVVGRETIDAGTGNLPDVNRLSVLPEDANDDGIPDNIRQEEIMISRIVDTWSNIYETDTVGQYVNLAAYGKRINNSALKGLDNDISIRTTTTSAQTTDSKLTFAGQQLVVSVDDSDNLTVDRVYLSSTTEIADGEIVTIEIFEFVYFYREDSESPWEPISDTIQNRIAYMSEGRTVTSTARQYDRAPGRYPLNFAWFHYVPNLNLVDPASSNIIDTFIITKGYYTSMQRWIGGVTEIEPPEPTPLDLRSSYSELMDNRMISDTLILHPGRFKILFGTKAIPQLRAKFKIVRPDRTSKTDNQVKVEIASVIQAFFDVESWEFGETFYFTELAASIHSALGPEIDSVLLVPTYQQNQFGDMLQIQSREDEVFIPDISTDDIEIIESLTEENLRIGVGLDSACSGETAGTTFLPPTVVTEIVCSTTSGMTGEAVAGCAIAGTGAAGGGP